MKKWRMPRLIRSFWTDISANHRSIGKHRLDVRLRIFYWLSTGLMENLITFPARFASGFEVGGHTQIWGRIQSREYMKKLSEEESEKRIAYEISVSKLEYLES